MPLKALKNVEVDHRLGAGEIGILLSRLSLTDANEAPEISEGEMQKTEIEIQIASEDGALTRGIRLIGEPSSFSCPDCQGVMLELKDGKIVRFRCHTGHAYTADSFLETVSANVEKELWSSERAIEELVMLLNHLGDELERLGESESAGRYRAKAQNTQREADAVLELIKNHELVSAEMLRNEVSA
jgi:two-component system chemotaxis response regulator CheB